MNRITKFLISATEGFKLTAEETAFFLGQRKKRDPEAEFRFSSNARRLAKGKTITSAHVLQNFLNCDHTKYRANIALLVIYSGTSTEKERLGAQQILETCKAQEKPGGSYCDGVEIAEKMRELGFKMHPCAPVRALKDFLDGNDPTKSNARKTICATGMARSLY